MYPPRKKTQLPYPEPEKTVSVLELAGVDIRVTRKIRRAAPEAGLQLVAIARNSCSGLLCTVDLF